MNVDPRACHGTLPERLGFRIEHVAEDRAIAVLDDAAALRQAMGVLHGGALFALADSAAASLALHAGDGRRGATTDATIRFLRAVESGPVRATATVRARTGSTLLVEVELHDDGDALVGVYTGNFVLRRT